MKYYYDLDGTICVTTSKKYAEAVPYIKVIQHINKQYKDGHHITIYTARGNTSGIDYRDLTAQQLCKWGVLYHQLITKKPDYDLLIDDRAISAEAWRKSQKIQIVGFVASSFDLLHPGHCLLLRESKTFCDYLIAAVHDDPSKERSYKNKPIQSLYERTIQLESVKYVDEIIPYYTESGLEIILSRIRPDIRILGSDAKDKPITGEQYCKVIYYHNRNHNYSSTELRERLRNECR